MSAFGCLYVVSVSAFLRQKLSSKQSHNLLFVGTIPLVYTDQFNPVHLTRGDLLSTAALYN